MKTGLVLEGGAMRGIYTAGVLDVFLEQGISPGMVMGVSAGAIHGISFLSRQGGRSIRYYMKYCRDKRFMSFYSLVTTGDVVGEQFCYHDIPDTLDPFDHDAFEASGIPFWAVCSNLETGQGEYIRCPTLRGEAMEYLRASASMPFLSRPIQAGGKLLLDGGVCDSIPALAALTEREPVEVRFIELMPIGDTADFGPEAYLPCEAVLERLPRLEPAAVERAGVAERFCLPECVGDARTGMLTLWPHRQGTDGFFICKLRKEG